MLKVEKIEKKIGISKEDLVKEYLELLLEKCIISYDEDKGYYAEVYLDYNDYLEESYIKEKVQEYQKHELNKLYDNALDFVISEIEESYYEDPLSYIIDTDHAQEIYNEGYKDKFDAFEDDYLDMYSILSENVSIYVDSERILRRTRLQLNVIMSSYDEWNREYTSISDGDYEDTGLNKFTLDQVGKSVDEIIKEYNENDKIGSFEQSVIEELANLCSACNVFTIFLDVDAYEYLELLSYVEADKEFEITIKDAESGLVDYFVGSGSLLGIGLNKPITLKNEDVTLELDGENMYGVSDIYGRMDFKSDHSIKLIK